MKKYLFYVTAIILLFLTTNSLAAQGKGKEKKAEKQEERGKKAQQAETSIIELARENETEHPGGRQPGEAKQPDRHGADQRPAQEQERPDRPKAKKDKTADQAERPDKGKGHAYGKDKGDMSGREFGQARATAARAHHQEKKEEAAVSVTEARELATEAEQRLSRARTALAAARESGKFSAEELAQREAAIERAAAKLSALQASTAKTAGTLKKEEQ